MATAISRNPHFRYITHRLYSHTLNQWRSANSSSPSLKLLHGVSETSQHRRLPISIPVVSLGREIQSLTVYYRFLCSTPITANPENPASKSSAEAKSWEGEKPDSEAKSGEGEKPDSEAKSGEGENSGESHQTGDAGKSVRGGPVSWLSFLLLVATGAGLILYYDKEKKRHIEEIDNASTAVKQGPSVGKAAIGGPFNLTNQDGKHVTDRDFLGKWTLIYFGFTHCPDICPDELQKLAAAIDKIKEKTGIEVVPVFISVDPERDTVEQVGEYVKEFHPKLIGLTGDSDEIRKVARAYRVYYMKTGEEDSDYLVDHSIIMYLMGPDMEFVKFFGKNYDVDALTDGVIKEIKNSKK
ncbi:hypothetical protein L1049_008015 [Liquidambar formosana]|uniref:Thioredoxin domain-containing protein n=1 Tax=Liquidambar formosana TaxID=63359 RepID=A0AAP0X8V5_LIQFO